MERLAALLCLSLWLTGCAARSGPEVTPMMATPGDAAGEEEASGEYPVVKPVLADSGTVVSVNSPLRFVVLDFGFHLLPERGSLLEVYRDGMKVGELRVSGPSRGSTTVADITGGEAQTGDEVRPPGISASESAR